MNVDRPLYGWLTADMQIDTGPPCACDALHPAARRAGDRVPARSRPRGPDVTAAQVLAATEACFGAIDVLDSALRRLQVHASTTSPPTTRPPPASSSAARRSTPTASTCGSPAACSRRTASSSPPPAGAAVMGHPAAAVAWLVRALAERGQGLEAGHVVMAGGMTEAVAVAPGDTVVARFDRLGSVEIASVAACRGDSHAAHPGDHGRRAAPSSRSTRSSPR